MKEHQRKQLLERVGREGATVGTRIPERIEIGGKAVDLRAFVLDVKRRESVPSGQRERVDALKKRLRRERLARRRTIESGEVSFETGEAIAEAILGIDRALNALESLEPADLEAEAAAREAADQKRWSSFLHKVLGDDDRRRSRP